VPDDEVVEWHDMVDGDHKLCCVICVIFMEVVVLCMLYLNDFWHSGSWITLE